MRATHRTAFRLLFREFFAQLFLTEWSASDHQLRKGMIGVFAFLVTPGVFIPLQLSGPFGFASLRDPALLDALTRLMAAIFLAYAMVTIGVIAAFEWDALVFDRRDAMVIGPLPVDGPIVVAAKASALAALLFIAAASINGLTAITFSFVATAHQSIWATARMCGAHVIATMTASVFVFAALVIVRSLVGLSGRGRVVVGSILQFAVISALLCFLVFAPTAVRLEFPRRAALVRTVAVQMQPVPSWSPTNWFAALYDELRGGPHPGDARQALVAVGMTFGAALAALAAIAVGYRRQLQLALTPASRNRAPTIRRLPGTLARLCAGRDRTAQALSGFVITTLARNRAQQASVAMSAAIAVVMITVDLSVHRSELASRLSAFSPLPFLLLFWIGVGLRASFFVPAELPAAWILRFGRDVTSGRVRHATNRAALAVVLLPITVLCATAVSVAGGPWAVARHAAVAIAATLFLVEAIAATVRFVPYSRPYQPGHARLKTRWPLYGIGAYAFAYRLPDLERWCWDQPIGFTALIVGIGASSIAIDLIARRQLPPAGAETLDDIAIDEADVTVLGILAEGTR